MFITLTIRDKIISSGRDRAKFVIHLQSILACSVLFFGIACNSPSSDSVNDELRAIHDEIRLLKELKHEVRGLEDDIELLKRIYQHKSGTPGDSKDKSNLNTSDDDAPIRAARFVPSQAHLNDPYLGDNDADILVMIFNEFQCRPCRQFFSTTFPQLKKEFADSNQIKLILRDFPLEIYPYSRSAATLAHCAGEQGKYWAVHDLLFENQDTVDDGQLQQLISSIKEIDVDKIERCLASSRYDKEIVEDIEEGKILGAKGAPGFFIGKKQADNSFEGVFVRGAQPYPVLRDQILKQLKS